MPIVNKPQYGDHIAKLYPPDGDKSIPTPPWQEFFDSLVETVNTLEQRVIAAEAAIEDLTP